MPTCPAEECSKEFGSFKALSAHTTRCKFMPGVMAATAKHYVELGNSMGARKRRRTSFSTVAGDEEEMDDAGATDFEVRCCCNVPTHPCQLLTNHRWKNFNNPLPSSLKTTLLIPVRPLSHLAADQGATFNSL